MSQYNINFGKVIEVSNITISVKVNDEQNYPYVITNSQATRIGGVSNFVKVENDIYQIVNEKETLTSPVNNNCILSSSRTIVCQLCGYFENNKFKQGSSGNTPNIFENVYTVSDNELNLIYAGASEESSIHIGNYILAKNLDFRIDINKFFASHTLIVGNTGSGKSNTLNTIYTDLFLHRNIQSSKFLIIDTNGEYTKAFSGNKIVKNLNTYSKNDNEIHIPINIVEAEDWKLILEATDKTQFPIIKKVYNYVNKNIFSCDEKNAISNSIINNYKDTICGILNSSSSAQTKLGAIFDISNELEFLNDDIYKQIRDMIINTFNGVSINGGKMIYSTSVYDDITNNLATTVKGITITVTKEDFNIYDFGALLNNEHTLRSIKYNTNSQNTSPMIARFNSIKKDLSCIFKPYNPGEIIELEKELFEDKNILVCNVTKSKKDIRRIMVTFICAKLYNSFINKDRTESSLHLIVDEAHNYLSEQKTDKEDAVAKTCIETFENIIKEGRKFSVFLTISTQRPSDITGTLLSQAHNYIIHKLVNPKDIDIIKNSVPFIDDISMKMLSVLAPGQAIFTGTAFNRPNIVQVNYDESMTMVQSDTIKLNKIWKQTT